MAAHVETQPPAFRLLNENGASPFVLVCEHASRFMPEHYAGLGLDEGDLKRHIAWDIGAENVAMQLCRDIDAPLILANYSRLLIDLNRPPTSKTSIPEISEMTVIPGNRNLAGQERQTRIERYFGPFQARLSQLLDARQATARPTTILAVHSFTPVFKGVSRPWHAGILFRRSATFGRALVAALGGETAHIAENQPYQIEDDSDYTVPVHGEARGLDAVLIELRQDLIASEQGAADWAGRLGAALAHLQPA